MNELILQGGGRPFYTDDFATIQDAFNAIQDMLGKSAGNCVLSGCEYSEELNDDKTTYTVNVTEGYVLIDNKIRKVNAATFETVNMEVDYPLFIIPSDTESAQKVMYKDGSIVSRTMNHLASVVTKSIGYTAPSFITLSGRNRASDPHPTRFTNFYDQYKGINQKADKTEVNGKASIINLAEYKTTGSKIPTFKAVFVHNNDLVHFRTITIPSSDDVKFGGLAEGTYYIFCIKHKYESNSNGIGTDFLLYDVFGRYVNYYDTSNVLECILEVFGELTATSQHDGLMTKEQVQSLGGKADKSYVDLMLSNKPNKDESYTKQEVNNLLATKVDEETFNNDKDILWGEIKMFSGESIPKNYHLCNGEFLDIPSEPSDPYYDLFQVIGNKFNPDDTPTGKFALPDLSGRFIVGRGKSDKVFAFRTSGGSSEVTLTEAQMPKHKHLTFAEDDVTGISGFGSDNGMSNYTEMEKGASGSGAGGTCQSGAAGNGQAHDNLPPYYVLAYIIRVSK